MIIFTGEPMMWCSYRRQGKILSVMWSWCTSCLWLLKCLVFLARLSNVECVAWIILRKWGLFQCKYIILPVKSLSKLVGCCIFIMGILRLERGSSFWNRIHIPGADLCVFWGKASLIDLTWSEIFIFGCGQSFRKWDMEMTIWFVHYLDWQIWADIRWHHSYTDFLSITYLWWQD